MTHVFRKSIILLTLAAFVFFYYITTAVQRGQPEKYRASDLSGVFTWHSIFFIETAGKDHLNPRQACAVESAARTNQNSSIHVMLTSARNESQELFQILSRYENVDFIRIHVDEYLAGTPLEGWTKIRDLERSPYRVAHMSDLLRLVTLKKYGGLYLDMDVVVARDLQELGCNWAGFESEETPGSSVLCFDTELGSRFTDEAIKEIRDNYRSDLWGHNGPLLVARVMKRMCTDGQFPDKSGGARCRGLRMFPSQYFFPIPYVEWKEYFQDEEPDKLRQFEDKTYVYHLWNNFSSRTKTNENMPYARLSKKFCPKVYEFSKHDF